MVNPIPRGIHYNAVEDLYEYQSHSDYEKTYLVMCHDRIKRKDWSCTCYDFMYRKKDKGQKCKHIKRVEFIDQLHRVIDAKMPQNKALLHEPGNNND